MSTPAAGSAKPESNPAKKRRIEVPAVSVFQVHHQVSSLHAYFVQNQWSLHGTTRLFLSTLHDVEQLALHVRGAVEINSVQVHAIQNNSLQQLSDIQYFHLDPLEHVLLRTNMKDERGFDADAQSSRGANGMTLSLRAASIASNLGELRIQLPTTLPEPSPVTARKVTAAWKQALSAHLESADEYITVTHKLRNQMNDQTERRRMERIDQVAAQLTQANFAVQVTVDFSVRIDQPHQGGLHAVAGMSPHLYTTAGVYGDHEGPRCYLPVLDSAKVSHRASHVLDLSVTAPVGLGLSAIGFGEEFGVSDTILHLPNTPQLAEYMGAARAAECAQLPVPEAVVDGYVLATQIWCSQSWTPIPARSVGFALGPFKLVADPEYFSDPNVERGEGIRQAYFAPRHERPLVHLSCGRELIPQAVFAVQDVSPKQKETSRSYDETVLSVTTGVTHRALSITRDILALPTYRTTSYTQIWIPGAVHGGSSCGALHQCPEVYVNAFLGGAIMDSRLLPPVRSRLPYYRGGRVLQFLQARCAIRGWITAALPLGGSDDVGTGYILTLIESFIMSLYERGHGGHGEGGAKGGAFFSKRYSSNAGLNSTNLDFLPVQNIEDMDLVIEGVGAVPVEDRHNEQLWRGANNGTESHTSSMDEYSVRQLLIRDSVEALERGHDKEKGVPSPSMGWFGSYLSLSFLSSNASSSSDLGCGAVELQHPVGGMMYRSIKCELFRGVVEGRAGVANFIRLIRAAFIASHLHDIGETELKIARRAKKNESAGHNESHDDMVLSAQPFVVSVNEILKKKGLSHTLFTRALQNLSGKIKEPQLLGTLVDAERHAEDPRTRRPFVDPEGFPNSYVRGASQLYCRVGVQVESGKESSSQAVSKGIHVQAYAEPVIPDGGIAFGGPITIRVVENEGSFREYLKNLSADGSRKDWGASFLHAKPVTTQKAQTTASGSIESSSKESAKAPTVKKATLDNAVTCSAFDESDFHAGGYQAIELIRLMNLTPLLWVRVDPMGLFGGRISVFQPDACLAEQLFHDGDAAAQIDAVRSLAERPLQIQGTSKINLVYDVPVSQLPVRVLGDCLRGSPALHSSPAHTPTVRSHTALAIAQWQNNKGPKSKDAVGAHNWVGLNLLVQYFRERYYSQSVVMPTRYTRVTLKNGANEVHHSQAAPEAGLAGTPASDDYQYLDDLDMEERKASLESAESVEIEEDEEYRVRSSVVTAVACVRAKDDQTPPLALEFLETVLEAEDAEMVGSITYEDEEILIEDVFRRYKARQSTEDDDSPTASGFTTLRFVSSGLVADALLALCYVNCTPAFITDPVTGNPVQATGKHPLSRLMNAARNWLEWELYRENIRLKADQSTGTGISGNCHDTIAVCAIISLANLAILVQSTTDATAIKPGTKKGEMEGATPYSAEFYSAIFDSRPYRNDSTRAAAAQAMTSICCASDRFDGDGAYPTGLLSALEFLLDGILDPDTSPALRHSLAAIMTDACTGKVCSLQRVAVIAGRNDLISSITRLLNGPLGACHGGDNGSAILMTVSASSLPGANAVNDGARRGMRLLSRAGHPKDNIKDETVVRVALFATKLWRTINGELAELPKENPAEFVENGVCAYDGILRCSLLALWQWIWPKGCFALLQVQSWRPHERYTKMGADQVMKCSDSDKEAAEAEGNSLSDIARLVDTERDRQVWRGEMARKAYDIYKATTKKPVGDIAGTEKGVGTPLPPIIRDAAFKHGGWISSAAQQRRELALDGGSKVTKIRLKVKSPTT